MILSDNAISSCVHQNLCGGGLDDFMAKLDPTTTLAMRLFLQGLLNCTTLFMDGGLRAGSLCHYKPSTTFNCNPRMSPMVVQRRKSGAWW